MGFMWLYFELNEKGYIMPKRQVYHVTKAKQGGWNVLKEGGQRASLHTETKAEAIMKGRDLAKQPPLGQLKIHKADGTIQTEYTYGKDPRNIPG